VEHPGKSRLAQPLERLAKEFEGMFSRETIHGVLLDSYDDLAATATVTVFLDLFTERFARERLRAAAQAEGRLSTGVPEVLFVCVHNAGRSQMAAALLDHLASGTVNVRSAGSAPSPLISPVVVEVMAEIGVDLAHEFPKPLTDGVVRAAELVVTMGCGDACPVYAGKRYVDWALPDPSERSLNEVRAIRDDIEKRVRQLLAELLAARSGRA